jgi:hypothetical protein
MGAPVGNNNNKKNREWSEAIRKAVVQRKELDKLANALIDRALEGDLGALKELGDRLEGKPSQQIDVDANVTGNITLSLSNQDADL